jgi:hypothetical protein
VSGSRRGLTLRHLAFTGEGRKVAHVDFQPGLNVIYGASNTGKSSIAKSLDFMLGASEWLKPSAENRGYEAGWLGLDLPDGRPVTLYRSVKGGNFILYEGFVTQPPAGRGRVLRERHSAKAADNVSAFLLEAFGLGVRPIVKNARGESHTVSFRKLAPYVIVEEGAIIDERSPVLSGQRQDVPYEEGILRLLLTGHDDAGVVAAPDTRDLSARNSGKIELIDDMIAELDAALGEAGSDRAGSERRAEALRRKLEEWTSVIRGRQADLDAAVARRRDMHDQAEGGAAHFAELSVTVARYEELDRVYASDLARLESLEENSFLLKTMRGRECPTCGASEDCQRHGPSVAEIELFHRAASAEMRKVERDRRDLQNVMESLRAEARAVSARRNDSVRDLAGIDREVERLRREEAATRADYEDLIDRSERSNRVIDLFHQRDRLVVQRSQLGSITSARSQKPSMVTKVDTVTAFAFAKVVERVLHAWGFPGSPQVGWSETAQDILIDGKERAANGKGVRAVLHAAFKVALMLYCHEKELPHPGFVVLDTPLLTYREPMDEKHGELVEDELAIKATSLNKRFYAHLAGMAAIGQVIVLENTDPPADIATLGAVTTFTKRAGGDTRYGFFPIE